MAVVAMGICFSTDSTLFCSLPMLRSRKQTNQEDYLATLVLIVSCHRIIKIGKDY